MSNTIRVRPIYSAWDRVQMWVVEGWDGIFWREGFATWDRDLALNVAHDPALNVVCPTCDAIRGEPCHFRASAGIPNGHGYKHLTRGMLA